MKSQIFTLCTLIFVLCLTWGTTAQTNFYRYSDEPLLQPGPPGSFDEWDASHPRVLFDGKMYHMWYTGMNFNYERGLGYATSKDGVNWMKYPDNPVLGPGEPGEWDDYGPEVPAIIYDKKEKLYKMWYMGANEPYASIGSGYATSPDGIHWTKYESNPVLLNGESGAWDAGYSALEAVVFDGEIYHGWFTGFPEDSWYAQIGYAFSEDGIHWTKSDQNPVLSPNQGTWNEAGIWVSSVVLKDGIFHMYYDGGDAWGNYIGYATSMDGESWTPYVGNPIYSPSNSGFDDLWVMTPWVLYVNNEWKMWHTALNQNGDQSMGYASSKKAPGLYKHLRNQADQSMIESIIPNPVEEQASIQINLSEAGHVLMTISRMNGTMIDQIANKQFDAGTHEILYDASSLMPGMYLCNFKLRDYQKTKLIVKE